MLRISFLSKNLSNSLFNFSRNQCITISTHNGVDARNLCTENEKQLKIVDVNFINGLLKFNLDDNKLILSRSTSLNDLKNILKCDLWKDKSSIQVLLEHHYQHDIGEDGGHKDGNKINFSDPLDSLDDDGNKRVSGEKYSDRVLLQSKTIAEVFRMHKGFIIKNESNSFKLLLNDSGHKKLKNIDKNLNNEDIQLLENQRDALFNSLKPLDDAFHRILCDAQSHTKRKFKWGGLFLLSAQLGFVARLTWFEYSWDIMEPITWCLTYSMMIASFAYYNMTSQEYLLPEVEKRLLRKRFYRIAEKEKFDIETFAVLQKRFDDLERKLIDLKANNLIH